MVNLRPEADESEVGRSNDGRLSIDAIISDINPLTWLSNEHSVGAVTHKPDEQRNGYSKGQDVVILYEHLSADFTQYPLEHWIGETSGHILNLGQSYNFEEVYFLTQVLSGHNHSSSSQGAKTGHKSEEPAQLPSAHKNGVWDSH